VSKPPRDHSTADSQTYFITANADGNRALFQSERVANLLVATLFAYRDQGKFLIHEFVIMPNHIHVLLTLGVNTTLERAMQLIKGGFSFRIKKDLEINTKFGNAATSIIEFATPAITPSTEITFKQILSALGLLVCLLNFNSLPLRVDIRSMLHLSG
jgi:REP element-mobilizing transposase RayT